MIELGGGADIFRLVGGLFWLLIAGALLAAVFVPKTRKGKLIAVAVVLGAFLAFPGRWAWNNYQEQQALQQKQKKAFARFEELCKVAGEKIHRTVEGVEGIALLKLRPPTFNSNDRNAVDPYGYVGDGDAYIKLFLSRVVGYGEQTLIGISPTYRYVDVLKEGKRYRYTAYMDQPLGYSKGTLKLKSEVSSGSLARFGVTYDDITLPADRDLWIAGSSLKIVDRDTNEVIAERIGYMVDRGLGSTAGFRQPWSYARELSCPRLSDGYGNPLNFVEKVLKVKE